MVELKARFVDHAGGKDRRIGDLAQLLQLHVAITVAWKIEASNTPQVAMQVQVGIANAQRVIAAECPVHARTEGGALLRRRNGASVEDNRRKRRGGAEYGGVDNAVVVDLAPFDVQEKAGVLVDRAADIAAVSLRLESGNWQCGEERVARIPHAVADVVRSRTVEVVRTRLGENFDASKAQLVEFAGERILVDANLADGFLRRQ